MDAAVGALEQRGVRVLGAVVVSLGKDRRHAALGVGAAASGALEVAGEGEGLALVEAHGDREAVAALPDGVQDRHDLPRAQDGRLDRGVVVRDRPRGRPGPREAAVRRLARVHPLLQAVPEERLEAPAAVEAHDRRLHEPGRPRGGPLLRLEGEGAFLEAHEARGVLALVGGGGIVDGEEPRAPEGVPDDPVAVKGPGAQRQLPDPLEGPEACAAAAGLGYVVPDPGGRLVVGRDRDVLELLPLPLLLLLLLLLLRLGGGIGRGVGFASRARLRVGGSGRGGLLAGVEEVELVAVEQEHGVLHRVAVLPHDELRGAPGVREPRALARHVDADAAAPLGAAREPRRHEAEGRLLQERPVAHGA